MLVGFSPEKPLTSTETHSEGENAGHSLADRITKPMVVFDWKHSSHRSPVSSEPHLVFCEARVDNRVALASRLSLSSEVTDSELILCAYEVFGSDCAKHILGDFAFAIWDPSKRCIFAARDIMGCQPVYYCCRNSQFVVAESIERLVAAPGVPRDPDEAFIAASLSYGFAHPERTGFEYVQKIPPGHFLLVSEDSTKVEPYWRPEEIHVRKWSSHDDCLDEFRHLLRQAVKDRLPQRGRTGVHVSGGLDCSSLAILAADELQATSQLPPVALSWYPPSHANNTDFERNEYARIESVCNAAGVDPVYTVQSKQNIIDVLNRDHMVRPICNASYNEWLVQKEAATRGVTTILSGFGGDEAASFNGRGYFQRLALSGRWLKLSQFTEARGTKKLRFCAGNLLSGLQNLFMSDRMLKEYEDCVFGMDVSMWKGMCRAVLAPLGINGRVKLSEDQQTLAERTVPYMNTEFRSRVKSLPAIPRVRLTNDRVARCQLLRWSPITARIESWAADGALHGIKYTYPLMDRRIVEFALALPGHVFRGKDWNRLFFRQAMEPILPHAVCWEKSKNDPARFNPLIASLTEAYKDIGRQLSDTATTAPKASYLDLDRLIRDLSPESLQSRTKLGRLIGAMEFLGTETLNEHRSAA